MKIIGFGLKNARNPKSHLFRFEKCHFSHKIRNLLALEVAHTFLKRRNRYDTNSRGT